MIYFKALFTTLLALLLSLWLTSDVNSDYITNMVCGVKDIEFSDFYDRVVYNQPEKSLSDEVVIVSIDSVDGREAIAHMLKDIVDCKPRVVGVDALFEDFHEEKEDSLLIDVAAANDIIILACEIEADSTLPLPTIFNGKIADERLGFVNLIKRNSQIVRTFMPSVNVNGNKVMAFAMRVFEKYDNKSFHEIEDKLNEEEEKLLFSPTAFHEIEGRDILLHQNEIRDKVVLVGCTSDETDLHRTPVIETMAGVEIWAHAVDNMIEARYLSPVGPFLDWFFAFVCCLFLSFLYIRLNDTNLQNFAIRFIPIVLMLSLCFIGCYLYYYVQIYLNVSKTILLSALGIFILDICYAFVDIIKHFRK